MSSARAFQRHCRTLNSACPPTNISMHHPKSLHGGQYALRTQHTVPNEYAELNMSSLNQAPFETIAPVKYLTADTQILATKGQILKVVVTGVPAFMSASFMGAPLAFGRICPSCICAIFGCICPRICSLNNLHTSLHCMTKLSASTQCNMINQSKALSVPSELNAPSQRL
jgi:hypothetical protein